MENRQKPIFFWFLFWFFKTTILDKTQQLTTIPSVAYVQDHVRNKINLIFHIRDSIINLAVIHLLCLNV